MARSSAQSQSSLAAAFIPDSGVARLLTYALLAVAGSIVLWISAKIQVPTWPVPVTLQTLAVAAVAAGFGARLGVATVALYLLEGVAGMPVFAGAAAGPLYLMGPTGGFLLGYLPMAFIIGLAADRGASRNFIALFGAMLIADAVVFAFGYVWLIALSGQAGWIDQSNVLASAFAKAIQPFIVWDILKMALAALTIVGGWQLFASRKG